MKKKILSIAMIATVAIAAAWSLDQSNKEMALADVALSNVIALAGDRLPERYGAVDHEVEPGPDGEPIHTYKCYGEGGLNCGH